jgi:UDP-N-acetyl-D-glucosamine dehydrogenase
MGYVRLPLALLFSEQKFPVTGFDIDQEKVAVLESGSSYIYRIAPSEVEAARDVRSAALEHGCADR